MPGTEKGKSDNQSSREKLITLRKAAEISGLSREHLSLLIRQGKLWGDKMGGRDWFTTERAVREYLARDRRPGPKSGKDA